MPHIDARESLAALRARLSLPVVVAPMFLVSGPELVLAACHSGVIGAFPAPNARTLEILDEWMERISRELGAARAGGARVAPWAQNLVAHSSYERLSAELELVDRYRPPLVITALGSPRVALEVVHGYGGLVIADVNSVQHARKAAAAGVDGLALVCAGAGGHTGRMSPFAFVPAVREFFDGIVIVAGGIGNGRGIHAAEQLGADLVSMGTRFIVAEESLAVAEYKRMIVESGCEDLVLTSAFSGADAYYLRQSIERAGYDPASLKPKPGMDLTGAQAKIKAWKDVWSAGQGVGEVRAVEPLARIVATLEREYRAAGGRGGAA